MARPRSFDEQAVVQRALAVFWDKGYHAASLDDLLAATSLSRSSLYEAFGSKRALVLEALRCYGRQLFEGPLAPLAAPAAARAEIEAVLRATMRHALTPDGRRGCFANSCLTEIAPHDAELRAAVTALRRRIEDAFARAVRRGQQDRTITAAEPARALARHLVNTVSGISLAAKSRPARAALADVLRVALRALD